MIKLTKEEYDRLSIKDKANLIVQRVDDLLNKNKTMHAKLALKIAQDELFKNQKNYY
ncbi:hypothetical protein [Romboutsia lituseburensis]|uniref:hypothetical protein n=1 Tax=Romboutsia lituseburensis TaxID=1537 RepID=UPI0022EB51D4|nr:hypothetical protein [Romboutsia lituseburensis]